MATEYLGLLVAWGRFCLTQGGSLKQTSYKWDRKQQQASGNEQIGQNGEFVLCFVGFLKRNGMTTKKHVFGKLI